MKSWCCWRLTSLAHTRRRHFTSAADILSNQSDIRAGRNCSNHSRIDHGQGSTSRPRLFSIARAMIPAAFSAEISKGFGPWCLADIGEVMKPGAPALWNEIAPEFVLGPDATEADRRAELAKYLTDPKNPLTWRSIVKASYSFMTVTWNPTWE